MRDHEVMADVPTSVAMERYVTTLGTFKRTAADLAMLRDQLAAALIAEPYDRDLVAPDTRPVGGGWLVCRWNNHHVEVVTVPPRRSMK